MIFTAIKNLTLIIILALVAAFGVSGCDDDAKEEQPAAETLTIEEPPAQIVPTPAPESAPAPVIEVPTPPECATNEDCSDGQACTDEKCVVVEPAPPPPPPAIDSDGDGIADESDICPNIPDENQEDYNANGVADACEIGNFSEEDVCTKHLHWWKIDNYKKWRANPDIYPNAKCTKFVDGSKTTSAEDGSETNPFKTIQAAVNTAVGGAVICIKPGVYHEHYNTDTTNTKDLFYYKNNFSGLVLNKSGTSTNPVVIAAVGSGDVILDGEEKYNMGIFISNTNGFGKQDMMDPKDPPPAKFIEVYGLKVINYKKAALDIKGSCLRIGWNDLSETHQFPWGLYQPWDADGAGLEIDGIDNDSDGIIDDSNENYCYWGGWGLEKDGTDNDDDGQIDDLDEWLEGSGINSHGVSVEWFTKGVIITNNKIHDNGFWFVKEDCNSEEGNVPADWNKKWCTKAPEALAPSNWKTNYPNKAAAAFDYSAQARGAGIYFRGSFGLIEGNEIYKNAFHGILAGYTVKDEKIIGNNVYNNGVTGVYTCGYGPYMIKGNKSNNNGLHKGMINIAMKSGLLTFPASEETDGQTKYIQPDNVTISGNELKNNTGYQIWINQNPECKVPDPQTGACIESFCPTNLTFEKNILSNEGGATPLIGSAACASQLGLK